MKITLQAILKHIYLYALSFLFFQFSLFVKQYNILFSYLLLRKLFNVTFKHAILTNEIYL